jgi:homocysteine S-methyltransferase
MRQTLKNILEQNQILVIDGSMGTALENLGADLNNSLWTARVLADRPELVKQVHLEYFRAGADAGITCSYQASIPGLMANGFSRQAAEDLITRSVTLFQEARQEWWDQEGKAAGRAWPLCLAGVGPYGAYLADGSEYRGHYGLSDRELYDFHKRRAQLLWEAGADVLLFETQPGLQEALVEARIARELGATFWISFSCRDGLHNCEGMPLREAAEVVRQFPEVEALGVNCTKPGIHREPDRGTEGGFPPACFRVSQQRGRIRSGDQDLAWGGHGPEIRRLCPGIHGGRSRGRWRLLHHGGRAYPAGGPGPGTVPGRNP